MEFLKQFFGDTALTYDQFVKALEASKDVKLGNLATGDYVGKGKYQAMETRVADLEEQIKTRDADLSKLKKSLGENAEAVSQLKPSKGSIRSWKRPLSRSLKLWSGAPRCRASSWRAG